MVIFVFDWNGILSQSEDVPSYLDAIRMKFPGCKIVLNSGMRQKNTELFDHVFNKTQLEDIILCEKDQRSISAVFWLDDYAEDCYADITRAHLIGRPVFVHSKLPTVQQLINQYTKWMESQT